MLTYRLPNKEAFGTSPYFRTTIIRRASDSRTTTSDSFIAHPTDDQALSDQLGKQRSPQGEQEQRLASRI